MNPLTMRALFVLHYVMKVPFAASRIGDEPLRVRIGNDRPCECEACAP